MQQFAVDALRGAVDLLGWFAAVHVEMMNEEIEPQFKNTQAEIWRLLQAAGFKRALCVDAAVWPQRVDYYDLLFMK